MFFLSALRTSAFCATLIAVPVLGSDRLPSPLAAQLQDLSKQMESIDIVWQVKITHLTKEVPLPAVEGNEAVLLPHKCHLISHRGLFRMSHKYKTNIRRDGSRADPPAEAEVLWAFDGKRLYNTGEYDPSGKPSLIAITWPSYWSPKQDLLTVPLFHELAGYRYPKWPAEARVAELSHACLLQSNSDDWSVECFPEDASGTDSYKIVAESKLDKGSVTYYFDANTANIYRYHAIDGGSRRTMSMSAAGAMQLQGTSVILPKTIVVKYHQYSGYPIKPTDEAFIQFNLTLVVAKKYEPVDKDDFALDMTRPGLLVGDATLPESKHSPDGFVSYTVPADVEDLDAFVANVRGQSQQRPERGFLGWLLIGINVAVAAFLGYLLFTRGRNRLG